MICYTIVYQCPLKRIVISCEGKLNNQATDTLPAWDYPYKKCLLAPCASSRGVQGARLPTGVRRTREA